MAPNGAHCFSLRIRFSIRIHQKTFYISVFQAHHRVPVDYEGNALSLFWAGLDRKYPSGGAHILHGDGDSFFFFFFLEKIEVEV